jgi:hypothetical protein
VEQKILKEALDYFKIYRNAASEMSNSHLVLISKLVKAATEAFNKPEAERTEQEKALIETFLFLTEEVNNSLKTLEKYNKSLENYTKGFKLLSNVAGGDKNDL